MLDPHPLGPVEGTGGRFAFLRGCTALASQVGRFNDLLARAGTLPADRAERRLASLERGADGKLRLKRLCVSLQSQATGGAFDADTFVMGRKDETLGHWRFPEDRRLPGAAPLVARLRAAGGEPRVLRYVPMRRLTLRGRGNAGDEQPVVAKAVEPHTAPAVFGRLRAVQAAFGAAPFGVPRVLHLDVASDVVTLDCLPGTPLSDAMRESAIVPVFERMGRLHREIHNRLPPIREGWSAQAFFAQVRERTSWLALLRPERQAFFEAVGRCLAARFPGAGISAFCHGDFRPTQILADGDDWSVVDFDDCCIADPHFEAGRLLALVKCDVPMIAERLQSDAAAGRVLQELAESAYLAGYGGAGGRFNAARLRWYRTCGEILHLAQSVRRDRVDEQAFEDACCRIETLCLEAVR